MPDEQHRSSAGALQNAVQIVFCSCPNDEVAGDISTALVEGNMAACVTQLPAVMSVYKWDGALCRNQESLLMIKTTEAMMSKLTQCIESLHPYELPEIIAVPCSGGSREYLQWVTTTASTGALK